MIPALRDVSLICLIVPTMLCLLIPLALLFGSNWLLRKGRRVLPSKLQSVHQPCAALTQPSIGPVKK